MKRFAILIAAGFLCSTNAYSQSPNGPTIIRAEAYMGQPYGVAKVIFQLGRSDRLIQHTGGVLLRDEQQRVFYPAYSDGLLSLIQNQPSSIGGTQTVWFIFRGDEPLNLVLQAGAATQFQVSVNQRRRALGRIAFQQWWRQFNAQVRARTKSGDYPPLVETYLTSMLGKRLGLPVPILDRISQNTKSEFQEIFELLFDAESIRAESIRQLITNPPVGEIASLALPPSHSWVQSPITFPGKTDAIEPIAQHVPEECFYLRFGNWDNQLWLKRLLEEYGGDISQMIQLRGHRGSDATKMLDQLVMESGQLDEWFGGNLIADVAVVGTDLYMEDGPSSGIILLAKNKSLENNISGRRKRFAQQHRDEGVTLEEIEIAGHRVTRLSAPDNHVLSFYAIDDSCHLITTSHTIVRRFFEAGQGNRSLAVNAEFQRTRETFPLHRDDTVFAYLSREFFQNVLSPAYQIELARRNRSLANIQLLQLAQMAANGEGLDDGSLEQMTSHGLLPEQFNQLPDASHCSFVDGHWIDSVRGRRGYFIPIADVEIAGITPSESAWVKDRLAFYAKQLGQIDPIVVALKRYELQDNVERVVFDARVSPFDSRSYGMISQVLGPPLEFQITTGVDDLISFQASLAGLPFLGSSEPFQVFAAVQSDLPPKNDLRPTDFRELLNLLKTTPGYLGAWPKPGFLDILPALGGQPDENGLTYSRLLDLWRMQHGDFSVVSFDRHRLEQIRDQLQVIPAEQPAQVRLRIGDIAHSNFRSWADVMFYQRAWETSVANVRLLNAMIQQFRLPPETALAQAEDLLAVQLTCPLGGQYALLEKPGGHPVWHSDKWPLFEDPIMPDDYSSPPMQWFRGMAIDVYQLQTQFIVHGSLDIQRQSSDGGLPKLPSFNLFNGFSKVEELPEALEQKKEASSGALPPPPDDDQDNDRRPRNNRRFRQ